MNQSASSSVDNDMNTKDISFIHHPRKSVGYIRFKIYFSGM